MTVRDVPRLKLERRLDTMPGIEVRAADDGAGPGVLVGHFAVFNVLATIRSYWEGTFREQIAPGSFKKTFAERAKQIRCIYEHGLDPTFGTKPLGVPENLTEDNVGAAYEVDLFDTTMNREHVVQPAEAGQLGASFAFDVLAEEWDDEPDDGGLPIRTITEVRLFEFGPCPFGAYDEATAGMRSVAASWHDLSQPRRDELAAAMATVSRTSNEGPAGQATGIPNEAATTTPTAPASGHDVTPRVEPARAAQVLALLDL